ncbi:MAG: DAHL domain-containing protein, partial [Candidatus Promineifilaceae bacterium]
MLLNLFWGNYSQEHTQVSSQLIELKELDARLDRDVLRITSFLLDQYDPVVWTINRLKVLKKTMLIRGQSKYETLDDAIATYWQGMSEKISVIERIKFQAALVRNGIHYLPTVAESMQLVDAKVYLQILELLNDLYLYDLFYTDSKLEEIGKRLDHLA